MAKKFNKLARGICNQRNKNADKVYEKLLEIDQRILERRRSIKSGIKIQLIPDERQASKE